MANQKAKSEKKPNQKLPLKRETLRNLSEQILNEVAGGLEFTDSGGCGSRYSSGAV